MNCKWLSSKGMLCGLTLPLLLASVTKAQPGLTDHERAMRLVRVSDVTIQSVQSGNWTDPATWGGAVPQMEDRVQISQGHDIVLSSKIDDRNFVTIRIDGSLHIASDADTHLRADTIFVAMSGSFTGGAESGHISEVVFEDWGGYETQDENSPDFDPARVGLGLISMGHVDLQGTPKTAHVTFDGALAGESTIELDTAPTGWEVGDKIVIAGTKTNAEGDEIRIIQAISGNQLVLDEALEFDHSIPANSSPIPLKVHIGNMSRNVIFRTANGNEDEIPMRGHVMMMSHDTDISNVAFVNLGRTNKMSNIAIALWDDEGVLRQEATNPVARYPLHFHRIGGVDPESAYVEGCVVDNSPGWGFVNHDSHVDFVECVAHDVKGAAFVAENGGENGSFVDNLSVRTHGAYNLAHTTKKRAFGHRGDGFWIQGLALRLVGNVATGATGHAFGIWGATTNNRPQIWNNNTDAVGWPSPEGSFSFSRDLYDDPMGYSNLVRLEDMRVEEFSNNTAYGSSDYGLFFASHSPYDRDQWTLCNSFLSWRINDPMHGLRYAGGVKMYNYTAIRGANERAESAFSGTHQRIKHWRFFDSHIEGFDKGLVMTGTAINQVYGGYFDCRVGVQASGGAAIRVYVYPEFGDTNEITFQGAWTMMAPCNLADLAEPYAEFDYSDISAFVELLSSSDPSADLTGDGFIDYLDVSLFLGVFTTGCP